MLSNIVHILPAGRNHSFSIMPDKYKTVNILHQIKNPRSLLRGFCFTGYKINLFQFNAFADGHNQHFGAAVRFNFCFVSVNVLRDQRPGVVVYGDYIFSL